MTEETKKVTSFEEWWTLHRKNLEQIQVLTMWHLEKVAHCAWNASKQVNKNE
jgi:hypothetical protein